MGIDANLVRISMEASNYGNAVILSNKGGLSETSKHYIKLNKLDPNNLYVEINNLIKNTFYSSKIL